MKGVIFRSTVLILIGSGFWVAMAASGVPMWLCFGFWLIVCSAADNAITMKQRKEIREILEKVAQESFEKGRKLGQHNR